MEYKDRFLAELLELSNKYNIWITGTYDGPALTIGNIDPRYYREYVTSDDNILGYDHRLIQVK